MAAASESPNEAAIAARKLAGEADSRPRSNTLTDATFAASSERGGHSHGGVGPAAPGDIGVVFVDDFPEEAEVDDFGSFAGRRGFAHRSSQRRHSTLHFTPSRGSSCHRINRGVGRQHLGRLGH